MRKLIPIAVIVLLVVLVIIGGSASAPETERVSKTIEHEALQ